ncbi:MAG: MarR family transcriptional regulator [Ruminococcaceae bacterium]|nr:MarR family transcriptional regulator [Oscillospiraceae bacterium]
MNINQNTNNEKMPPFVKDNNGAAFYWKIRNITHSRMHIIVEMLSEYDLHYTHPRVLGMIHRMNSPTQKELAEAMNTSPAAMSATLKRMQKAGLVEKVSLEEDSRKNKICLTEKGAKIHEDTFDKTLEIDRAMLEGFSEEETAELFAYLNRIQNNIDNIKNK